MGAQVRTGKQSFTKFAGATPRITEPQKIERKRITIVIKVLYLLFREAKWSLRWTERRLSIEHDT